MEEETLLNEDTLEDELGDDLLGSVVETEEDEDDMVPDSDGFDDDSEDY